MTKMTLKEACEILRAIQHAQELAKEGTLYGRIVTENTRDKEIAALDCAIKVKDKIDYKIESLEEELKTLGKKALKNNAIMRTMWEVTYAIEVLKWLNLEEWCDDQEIL